MSFAPSGRQFEISREEQRATVVEVGGGIREYVVGDRNVLEPYPLGAMCDGAHGAPLIPWPNRVAGGRYSFDGSDFQLALTEPPRQNAIHGLMRWRPWEALEQGPDRVTLQARLLPMSGYPFALDLTIAYELGDTGLTVSTSATNLGEGPCPYGAGQHPYLSPGSGTVDQCTLRLPAATRILTDERMIPTGKTPVDGTPFDFREPRPIGEQSLDVALTNLTRDGNGFARAQLTGPDGRCVELWADAHYEFLEVFTGDTLAPERRRSGLGVEPMTCAPNAFQSGEGLLRLQPEETVTTCWGVRLTDAAA